LYGVPEGCLHSPAKSLRDACHTNQRRVAHRWQSPRRLLVVFEQDCWHPRSEDDVPQS
jgi:hypothetical protein